MNYTHPDFPHNSTWSKILYTLPKRPFTVENVETEQVFIIRHVCPDIDKLIDQPELHTEIFLHCLEMLRFCFRIFSIENVYEQQYGNVFKKYLPHIFDRVIQAVLNDDTKYLDHILYFKFFLLEGSDILPSLMQHDIQDFTTITHIIRQKAWLIKEGELPQKLIDSWFATPHKNWKTFIIQQLNERYWLVHKCLSLLHQQPLKWLEFRSYVRPGSFFSDEEFIDQLTDELEMINQFSETHLQFFMKYMLRLTQCSHKHVNLLCRIYAYDEQYRTTLKVLLDSFLHKDIADIMLTKYMQLPTIHYSLQQNSRIHMFCLSPSDELAYIVFRKHKKCHRLYIWNMKSNQLFKGEWIHDKIPVERLVFFQGTFTETKPLFDQVCYIDEQQQQQQQILCSLHRGKHKNKQWSKHTYWTNIFQHEITLTQDCVFVDGKKTLDFSKDTFIT